MKYNHNSGSRRPFDTLAIAFWGIIVDLDVDLVDVDLDVDLVDHALSAKLLT